VEKLVYRPSLSGRLASLIDVGFGTFRGFVRLVLGELEFRRTSRPLRADSPEGGEAAGLRVPRQHQPQRLWPRGGRGLGARVASLGLSTTTGAPAFEKAVAAAPVYGFDLTAHRATNFTDFKYQPGDLLLAMEVRHAHELVRRGIPADAIALLGHWSRPHRIHIHDPHLHTDQYFRTCFAIIHSAVPTCRGAARGGKPMPDPVKVSDLRHRSLVWRLEGSRRKVSGELRALYGRSPAGDYALPKTLEILDRNGLKGVFFVEPLFAARFGVEHLATIVDLIRAGGHDVQLHLHPEWSDELRPLPFPAPTASASIWPITRWKSRPS
jgi:protein-tyrosine phosphatase